MSHNSKNGKDDLDEPLTELRRYASSPCYQHEVDPSYLGIQKQGLDNVSSNTSHQETVRTWRAQQRSRLVALRSGLSRQQQSLSRRTVVGHLNATGLLSKHKRVGFYWPLPGEIDLRPLLTAVANQGSVVALPVITKLNQPLEFWQWRPGDPLESGHWGIATPVTRRLVDVRLLLVPLVGFDSANHRLGHGGGYYDRTLAAMDQPPLTVGIGYESTRLSSIFPQPHDIAMDFIMTDSSTD